MNRTGYFRGAALLLTVGILASGPARAQVHIWDSHWNPGYPNLAQISAMAFTPDGDVVATGYSEVTSKVFEFATVKFAAEDGRVIWARTRPTLRGSDDIPADVAVDEAGNIFVCGSSRTGSRVDWVVVKYDADGAEKWSVLDNYGGFDSAAAVVADNNGGCYVAGHSTGDLVVAHYGPDGRLVWRTGLSGESDGNAGANALAACATGYLYAAGHRWTGADDKEAYWLVKLDPATGDTVWTRTYNGTAASGDPRDDRAFGVAMGPDGKVYVTGTAGEHGTWYDATTVAWDADGNRLWVNRFDAGQLQQDGAAEIAVCADGYVHCGGYTRDYEGMSELDFLVLRIRPDGELDWYRVFDGGVEASDSCTGLVLDAFGNIYATGITFSPLLDEDWIIVKYNAAGQQVWRTIVGEPEDDDIATSVLVNARGEVYVGGMGALGPGGEYTLRKYGQHDAAAWRIVAPAETLRVGAEVWPRVWVLNNSPAPLSFPVRCQVGNFYFDVANVSGLAPGDSVLVEFQPWVVRDIGDHELVFFTSLLGDHEPHNDTIYGTVTTVPVWEQLADMPYGELGRKREVRDGAALVVVEDTLIYAFKGNNTTEFYAYNIIRDTWVESETIPAFGSTGRRRRVRKGAALTVDAEGRIYALKGNNTLEFWRYDPREDSVGWVELANYLVSPAGKVRRVRGGGGLAYVEALNRIYSVKGTNTAEFYAYDIAGDSWLQMADVYPGPRERRVRDGSSMTYDGDNTIYLLKARTQEFAAYSISADTWVARPDLPYSEFGRRNKPNRGSGLAWDPTNERVYATKGRRSTEWWYFDVGRDAWVEFIQDSIPTGPSQRPPDRGSVMTTGSGKIYFLRGNKTLDFWRYHADLPLTPGGGRQSGAMARPTVPVRPGLELSVAPNPCVGRAVLRFALPQAGQVQLELFDVAGRIARRLLDEPHPAGSHSVALSSTGLVRGVYLARLRLATPSGILTAEQKVLIAR